LKTLAMLPDNAFVGRKHKYKRLIVKKKRRERTYPKEIIVITAKMSKRIVDAIRSINGNL